MSETEGTEDTPMNIYQRINAIQKEATYVQKTKPQGMKYAITSHDAVLAKLRPYLVEQGIVTEISVVSFNQNTNRTEALVSVTFVNMDSPEDRFTVQCLGYGVDPQDKGPGKAVSYAVKYALLKVFCMETGMDNDPDFHQGSESNHTTEEPSGDGQPKTTIKDELNANKEKARRRKAYDTACTIADIFGGKDWVDTYLRQEAERLHYDGLDTFSATEMEKYLEIIGSDVAKEESGRQ